jgi:broad specificity phosphatase PhoE
VSSDRAHGAGLTPRGGTQARRLGAQIANLEIDLAVCTRFLRTRETVDLALRGRTVPLLIEPGFDEIKSGVFDGAPIRAYWAWRQQHSSSARFPGVRRATQCLHALSPSVAGAELPRRGRS